MARRRRRPLFRSQTTAVIVGAALFAGGVYVLYDAFEGRGDRTPMILRPFLPT